MARQSASILVVEDSPSITLILRLVLEGEGYQVTAATSVAEAVEALHRSRVDLVLSDAFSQTAEGALESIAPLLAAAGNVPVALMTGHTLSREAVLAHGLCALIRKPFDLDTLLRQVQTCLEGVLVLP